MKIWIVRLIIFAVFMALFIIGGRLLPSIMKNLDLEIAEIPQETTDSTLAENLPDTLSSPDTAWKQELFDLFMTRNSVSKKALFKKHSHFWKILVPRGIPMAYYAVQMKVAGDSLGLKPPKGKTISSEQSLVVLDFYQGQDSLKILFKYGQSFKTGSARLALLWTGLDSLNGNELKEIITQEYDKTLILSSNHNQKKMLNHFGSLHFEKVVLAPLEPINYPYKNPGKETILIHHSEEKVRSQLMKHKNAYEGLSGIATHYGSRAIENKELIGQILKFTKENSLVFLDLTQSQRSVSKALCRELKAPCYSTKISTSNKLDKILEQKISTAKRYGKALLVLKYSPGVFHNLTTYFKNKNLKDVGVDLVNLSELSE